jgi:ankyrin repeat protein
MHKKITLILLGIFLVSITACGDTSEPRLDLLTAIDHGNVSIVEQHIASGTDINNYPIPKGFELEGAEPLHLAVVKGNAKIVRLLLENGANIDIQAKNKDKAPPLSWAVVFLQKEMVSLLVKSGSDINFVDENGATPVDAANYMKMISLKDKEKLQLIEEIIAILNENGGLSATDL